MRGPRHLSGTAARVLAAGSASAALVGAEAWLAAHRRYLQTDDAPPAEVVCGATSHPLLRLTLLGDAAAAGVGASSSAGTVGAQLGELLAAAERRRVEVRPVAVGGSGARDLGPQVSRALLARPDVAVLLVGAEDVARLTPLLRVRAGLSAALTRLRAAHVPTVVGTCPDLGAARALLEPLRTLSAWQGRRVAAAGTAAALAAGAVPVDLAALTGAAFRREPTLFARDGFHPSDAGYRVWAEALLPAVRRVTTVRLPS